jgi:ribonuclease E
MVGERLESEESTGFDAFAEEVQPAPAAAADDRLDSDHPVIVKAAEQAFTAPAPQEFSDSALARVPMPVQQPLFDSSSATGEPFASAADPVVETHPVHESEPAAVEETASHDAPHEPAPVVVSAPPAVPSALPDWMRNEVHQQSQVSIAAAPMPVAQLQGVLAAVGLELVQTDAQKLEAARDQAARVVPATRVPRERRSLPPLSSEPLIQVETRKD